MEEKNKKSLTALIDEKLAEKANKNSQAQQNDKQYNIVNAFSANFLKQTSLKDISQIDSFNEIQKNLLKEKTNSENLTIREMSKISNSEITTKNISLPQQPSVLETPNYDFIETINSPEIKEKTKVKRKFRAKLSLITYSIIFFICVCWTTVNGIQLSNLAREITDYQISIMQYVIKIDQTDSYKDGEGSLINNIIEVNPPAFAQPTQIQPQTNWFDRFCAWLSGLFK